MGPLGSCSGGAVCRHACTSASVTSRVVAACRGSIQLSGSVSSRVVWLKLVIVLKAWCTHAVLCISQWIASVSVAIKRLRRAQKTLPTAYPCQLLPAQQGCQALRGGLMPLTIVLDLVQPGHISAVLYVTQMQDETLIATFHVDETPAHIRDGTMECHKLMLPVAASKRTPVNSASKSHSNSCSKVPLQPAPRTAVNGCAPCIVVQRPGLREFLRRAAQFADLVLFTAATPGYALPIIQQIVDPDACWFKGRVLTRHHTRVVAVPSHIRPAGSASKRHEPVTMYRVKDLSTLGKDLRRVVLVDDSPSACLHQPANCLLCQPFHGAPSDNHLLTLLLPLLQSLACLPDVRPALHDSFQLYSYLVTKGLPAVRPQHIDEQHSEEQQHGQDKQLKGRDTSSCNTGQPRSY